MTPSSATGESRHQRTRVSRGPKKARHDRDSIEAALDASLFAHVAFVDGGAPYCIPMLHARVGDQVYVHGSSASRLVRTLADGAEACLTVTTLRGLVLARSAFEHSANYDSVMVFGRFDRVEHADERALALEAFTERMLPGRWHEVRGPNRKELKATAILSMAIAAASVKTRSGPPDDDDSDDAALQIWAGEIPIHHSLGEPMPSPGLRKDIPLADSVQRLLGNQM